MTNHSLRTLLLHRHRVWLILAAFLLLFFGVVQGTSNVNMFHEWGKYQTSEKDFNKYDVPAMKKAHKSMTYAQFIKDQRTLKYGNPLRGHVTQDGTFFSMIYFLTAIVLGCLMTFWDQFSGFNRLLFSSGARRRQILAMKVRLYLPVLLIGYLLGAVISYAIIRSGVPHDYLIFYWRSLFLYLPIFIIQLIAAFAAGSLFGIVIGQPLPLVITLGFLGISAGGFSIHVMYWLGMNTRVNYDRITSTPWFNYAFWLFFAILFIGLCVAFYPRISLENSHQYLLIPQLRPWVLAAFTIYVPAVTEDWLFAGQHAISMAITGIAVFSFLYWYLYRPQWLGRKSTQSANHSQTPAP
ncbi:ABC transporter permease [Schleiferilactobacillus harbinensis]|uniref:Uncharacterized protein n=1 Tax=Schleiferilactobacillus harbinensis DSM 16991 TaxID=1122147 RepID=A0A0R1XEK8_9LACO|nr:ABC transporter permease [Schleiferilactobacillus harbinensis]KRM28567.1 hypothetical protein FC91_GL002032 [Schleiferilactobacillus harbinensis DSM 16991]QFR64672.1 ABC transporter permease [Schleiferilactobacillus harbinensis]